MISKIIKFLFLVIAVGVITAALYILELPPFNTPAKPVNNYIQTGLTDAERLAQEQENLPDELVDKVSRSKNYNELMQRAALLEKNNFPTLAIAEYQQAATKDPQKLEPLFEIGKIHLRIANYDQAAQIFQSILDKSPTNDQAKIYLGRALISQRELTQAEQIFNTIGQATFQSKYYQGILAAYFQKHDDAKRLLNESLQMSPNEDYRKKAQNFLNAYNEYSFNAASPTVHLKVLLARSFVQTGEYQIAIPLLFEVTKEKTDYRDAWLILGVAYLNIEKYQDAIEALERAKTLDPEKPETLFYLGLSYYSINDFNKAQLNLNSAKENGYQPEIQIDQKLAEIYLQLQNFHKSAESYEQVIALNDNDVNYFVKPIWIYLEKTAQPDKALKLAEKAVKDHPKVAMSHNLMGWALIYNNQLPKAESHLKMAMALDPNLDATYLNYGLLFERKQQPERAISFYKKAHKLGQGSGVANTAADRYNKLVAQLNQGSATVNNSDTLNQSIQANTLN
jgi:tetratricopeptide (TPR) repeat protein